jgi:GntR family transcriptional regulator
MIKDEKTLIKDSPLPLYYQLKEILKSQIERSELRPGEGIPSERELVEHYEISRPTVRQAINELVTEGLLTREQGRGTFVSTPKISQWFLESLSSFSEEMNMKGLTYSTKVLSVDTMASSSTLRAVFGTEYDQFYRVERLRYVEGKPVVLVTTYLPVALFPDLEKENLEVNSLYNIIQSKYRYRLDKATRVLEAIHAPEEDAKLLQINPSEVIQLIRTTGYLENDRAFEYSIARYRGDLSSFTVSLKFFKQPE